MVSYGKPNFHSTCLLIDYAHQYSSRNSTDSAIIPTAILSDSSPQIQFPEAMTKAPWQLAAYHKECSPDLAKKVQALDSEIIASYWRRCGSNVGRVRFYFW